MKPLILLVVLGCSSCTVDQCNNSDYTTAWNICVFRDEMGHYSQDQMTEYFDLYFPAFERLTGWDLDGQRFKDWLGERQVSVNLYGEVMPNSSFVPYPTTGYVSDRNGNANPFESLKLMVFVQTNNNNSVFNSQALAHEFLHVLQYYFDNYDKEQWHAKPEGWFVDYNIETGEVYPDQEPITKLEYVLWIDIQCQKSENRSRYVWCRDLGY